MSKLSQVSLSIILAGGFKMATVKTEDGSISTLKLAKLQQKYESDAKNTIIRHALSASTMNQIAKTLDKADEVDYSFSLDIKTMPVTNQKQSGRCWIFAACNVLREIIAKFIEESTLSVNTGCIRTIPCLIIVKTFISMIESSLVKQCISDEILL